MNECGSTLNKGSVELRNSLQGLMSPGKCVLINEGPLNRGSAMQRRHCTYVKEKMALVESKRSEHKMILKKFILFIKFSCGSSSYGTV